MEINNTLLNLYEDRMFNLELWINKDGKKKTRMPEWSNSEVTLENTNGNCVAIRTGNSLVVVDIDTKDFNLLAPEWRDVIDKYINATLVIESKRGYHLYFETDSKVKSRADISSHIDVRGEGGIIFCQHNDGWYTVTNDVEPLDLPEYVFKLLDNAEVKYKSEKAVGIAEEWAKADEGSRNSILAMNVGVSLSQGYYPKSVLSKAIEWNELLDASLSEHEVINTVDSIVRLDRKNNPDKYLEISLSDVGNTMSSSTPENLKFVENMRRLWVDTFKYSLNDQLLENWNSLGSTFESSMDIKNKGKLYAFSMGAGEGKSTGTALYIAKHIIPQNKTAIVISNLIENAVEMVKNINQWSSSNEAYLVASDSISGVPQLEDVKDVKSAKVIVIAHERLKRAVHKRGKMGVSDLLKDTDEKYRDLIVIDEAIDFSETYTLRQDEIIFLSSMCLYNIKPFKEDKDRFEEELRALHDFNMTIVKIKDENRSQGTNYVIDYTNNSEIKEFKVIKKTMNNMIQGRQKNKIANITQSTLDAVEQLEGLMNSERYFVSNGNNSYISSSTDHMPAVVSPVVLDASAVINETYKQYEKSNKVKIITTVKARTFNGCTLHFAETDTGKSSMVDTNGVRSEVISAIESEVIDKCTVDDRVAICSHKVVRTALENNTFDGRNMTLLHFMNITGTNEARDCNKMFIVGLPHLPKHVAVDKMKRINNCINDKTLETKYKITQILDETYQSIMRCAVRVPINEDGDCAKTDIYITLPASKSQSNIAKILKAKLPELLHGCSVKEWKSAKTVSTSTLKEKVIDCNEYCTIGIDEMNKDNWLIVRPQQQITEPVKRIIDAINNLDFKPQYKQTEVYNSIGMGSSNFYKLMNSTDTNPVKLIESETGYRFGKYSFPKSRGGKFQERQGFKLMQ